MDQPGTDALTTNLEYVRQLYASVLDWYKNADSKAQVILTLDGIFLTLIANTLFQNSKVVSEIPWHTAFFLGLMAMSLSASIYHAIACIWSRIYSTADLKEIIRKAGVDIADYETYAASVCWFFQMISELDKVEFEKRMSALGPTFEVEALSSQIFLLSGNVRKKHHNVNYGFIFAGITLALFVISAISFVLYQKGVL